MARMYDLLTGNAVDVSPEKAARLSPRYWSKTKPKPAPEDEMLSPGAYALVTGAAEADPSAAPDGPAKPSESSGATDTPVKAPRGRGRPSRAGKAPQG
jgi:hypothetical protein